MNFSAQYFSSALPVTRTLHWHRPQLDFLSCWDLVHNFVCSRESCGWWGRARCGGSPDTPTSCRDPSMLSSSSLLGTTCLSRPLAGSQVDPGWSINLPPSCQTFNIVLSIYEHTKTYECYLKILRRLQARGNLSV